ncbi:MAG TPA: hypothetical protein DCO79_02345 [Spirochaeta sp.]|nr:hypothetical protein [Spirochaeta sp.]
MDKIYSTPFVVFFKEKQIGISDCGIKIYSGKLNINTRFLDFQNTRSYNISNVHNIGGVLK